MAHAGIRAWPARRLDRVFDGQHGRLFPWVPVCLGIGIGCYFALPEEPSMAVHAGLAGAVAASSAAMAWGGLRAPLMIALTLVAAGVVLAGARAHLVAAPVLEGRYYGAVEGRIVAIDRSASDAMRLTLDRVVLEWRAPSATPARVRISLHGRQDWLDPVPGQVIVATAFLSPPPGPAEPGGYDFRRRAWFDRLGAVGYTRSPVLLLDPGRGALPVERVRAAVAGHLRDAMPGDTGAFSAAITVGDRSAIPQADLEALRASNLAHLLAISGLHMVLLTGVVFGALRLCFAAVPVLVLLRPVKTWAAAGALVAAAAYLAVSGGNVATQRAFVMVAVVLVATILGRRAVTMRSVALAATIVLVVRPEALTEAGFQMSFAATVALVAAFRAMRDRGPGRWRGVRGWAVSLVLSSAVAGAATAPFAAAHFNQIAQFGLVANVLSVPLMGLIIVPGAVLAAVLAPLGLAWVGLWLMVPGILWILHVAHWVAGFEAARIAVVEPVWTVLPLLSIGALWAMLWSGRAALAGLGPVAVALWLWTVSERPALLVDEGGGLIGLRGPEGRALSKPEGQGFAASVWLENDGDLADQTGAAARDSLRRSTGEVTGRIGGREVVLLSGRGAAERAVAACHSARIVVTTREITGGGDCLMLDAPRLARTGSVAFHETAEGLRMVTSGEGGGHRLWTRDAPDQ